MNSLNQALLNRIRNKRIGKRSLALSKAQAHDYFKGAKNHKTVPKVVEAKTQKNDEYRKMSISDWEKTYLK